MLPVAADNIGGRGAQHQACAGLKHRIDFFADHQLRFAIGILAGGGEFRQAKTDDLTGFERQHGTCEPRKPVIRRPEEIAR